MTKELICLLINRLCNSNVKGNLKILQVLHKRNIFLLAAWSSGWSAVIVINMVSVQYLVALFCCVLGKDTLRHFPCWQSWQAVLNFCHICINLKKQNKKFQLNRNMLASPEPGRSNCLPYVLAPPSLSCESGG